MSDNGIAGRADLLALAEAKRRYTECMLPVAKLRVRIQSLTEGELSDYQNSVLSFGESTTPKVQRERLAEANRKLIAACVVDGSNELIFSGDMVNTIRNWDAVDTQVLYEVCAKHSGIRSGDIEDLVKN